MYQKKENTPDNTGNPSQERLSDLNLPKQMQPIVKGLCLAIKEKNHYNVKKLTDGLPDAAKKEFFQSTMACKCISNCIVDALVKNGSFGAEQEYRFYKSLIGETTFNEIINSNIFIDKLKKEICRNVYNKNLLCEASMLVTPEVAWEIESSPEFSITFYKYFCNTIKSGKPDQIEECWNALIEYFDDYQLDQMLNSAEVFEAAKDGVCTAFANVHADNKRDDLINILANIFGDDFLTDVIDTQEVYDAVQYYFSSRMDADALTYVEKLCGKNTLKTILGSKETTEAAINSLCKQLENGRKIDNKIEFLRTILDDNQMDEVLNSEKIKIASKAGLILLVENISLSDSTLSCTSAEAITDFSEYVKKLFHLEFHAFFEFIQQTRNTPKRRDLALLIYLINEEPELKITAEHLVMAEEKKYLNLLSIQKALEQGIDLDDKKALYDLLKRYSNLWKDPQISKPFEKGIEYFGYDAMFNYIDGIDLHDAMISFDDICELCDEFGTDESVRKRFYHNVIAQVKMDNSDYTEGKAYQHFNAIARELAKTDIDEVIKEGESKCSTFDEISELVKYFSDKNNIIASWHDLKKFIKLKKITEKSEILENLRIIKEKEPALYEYAKTLYFHKDSKVGIKNINEFVYDISEFLARDDEHTRGIHELIKPSNYSKYGLSAEEARTALITGKIDAVQVIKPMSMILERRERPLLEYLQEAIVKKDSIPPRKATNPKKIYASILALGLDPRKLVTGKTTIPEEDEDRILRILKNDHNMQGIIRNETELFMVEICKKSDPMTALLGDDTSCCMYFGSGKNNVYLFSGDVSFLRVSKILGDGTKRTIAQCVLTNDLNIGRSENKSSIQNIPIDLLKKHHVLTCDSVEVRPNYRQKCNVVEDCLRFFLKRYLDEYAESSYLEKDRVIIGLGYTKAFKNLPRINNTFIPASLISYSDNSGKHCAVLDFNTHITNVSAVDPVKPKKHRVDKYKKYRITRINPNDVVPIAVLGKNIYGDKWLEGITSINTMINAVNIRNSLYGKENFMFKVISSDRSPLGYFIAYEKRKDEKKAVFIADFATIEPEKDMALSAHMMLKFLKKYRTEYSNEEKLPPVFAKVRENSAYKLIKDEKRLNSLLSHFGLGIKVSEREQEIKRGEVFHNCRFHVYRNETTPEMAS